MPNRRQTSRSQKAGRSGDEHNRDADNESDGVTISRSSLTPSNSFSLAPVCSNYRFFLILFCIFGDVSLRPPPPPPTSFSIIRKIGTARPRPTHGQQQLRPCASGQRRHSQTKACMVAAQTPQLVWIDGWHRSSRKKISFVASVEAGFARRGRRVKVLRRLPLNTYGRVTKCAWWPVGRGNVNILPLPFLSIKPTSTNSFYMQREVTTVESCLQACKCLEDTKRAWHYIMK